MQLETGERVAGYEIVRHVKSGGMASLYLARRRGAAGFRKLVALKLVHPEIANDPRFVQMFLDEARLAARIAHPNVVHVEELLEEHGTYVMIMEYVHGPSLAKLLSRLANKGRRLTPDLATWITVQIAEGLHAAHELRDAKGEPLNVVHRDVSPQNVLVAWDGHVKVIDFGIAKSRSASQRTGVGVLRGKIPYMSPEQARAKQVDRRTDVYALGIMLWEMLTSRRLFRGNSEIELLEKVRVPKVPRPSTYAAVDGALEAVVLEALQMDPERRIPSAKILRDRLLHARPRAATIHSSLLEELLQAVMGDEYSPLLEGEETAYDVESRPPQQTPERTIAELTAYAPHSAYHFASGTQDPDATSGGVRRRNRASHLTEPQRPAPVRPSQDPPPPPRAGALPPRRPAPPPPRAPPPRPAPRPAPRPEARPPARAIEPTPHVHRGGGFVAPPPTEEDLVDLAPAPAPDREAVFAAPPTKRPMTSALIIFFLALALGAGAYLAALKYL